MQNKQNYKLSSGEVSQLWANYMTDSMSICLHSYFKETVEDPEVRALIEHALELSKAHIQELTTIFESQNFPIPIGFTEEDVNVTSPRLFTDNYYLYFLLLWSAVGLEAYSLSLHVATHSDVVTYFSKRIDETKKLHIQTTKLLLSKGLFIHSPYTPYPNKVDFVQKQNFLTGWFGERRPLTTLEITNLYVNNQRNALFYATLIGFGQVAKNKEVIRCMDRGKDIASKHLKAFDSVLHESDLPASETWDTMVTDSTAPVFSDKLMMFHLSTMLTQGIGFYGTSLGSCSRRDLGTLYLKIFGDLVFLAEDTANVMIDNGWMEQPPSTVNRDKLGKNG